MMMIIFTVPEENGRNALTMAEYIEREALMHRIKEIHCAECDSYHGVRCRACWVDDTLDYIDSEPAADVAPVRHGRWVDNHCTACGMMPMGDEMWEICDFEPPRFEKFMDYCPNCGAKMDRGVDDASV